MVKLEPENRVKSKGKAPGENAGNGQKFQSLKSQQIEQAGGTP